MKYHQASSNPPHHAVRLSLDNIYHTTICVWENKREIIRQVLSEIHPKAKSHSANFVNPVLIFLKPKVTSLIVIKTKSHNFSCQKSKIKNQKSQATSQKSKVKSQKS